MSNLLQLFLLSLLGSIIALAGGVVFLYNKKLSNVLERHSIPFAAGVLITVALLALIPESFEILGESSLVIVLLSFFGAYLLEHFLVDIHHHGEHHHHNKSKDGSIMLVIVGDTIHNFIDGIAIAASFFVNPGLGLVTAFSTFLHEIPHEIGDFGVLLKAGWKRAKVLKVNTISASFTIVGAFTTFFIAESDAFVGGMMAISAGIFLYLGTIDFLPKISHGYSNRAMSLVPLVLGIAIMMAVLMLVPHSH